MAACELKPSDKRQFIGEVGEELVRAHGKKKYYKPSEIRKAADRRGYPIDIHCWAMSVFSTPEDFKDLHETSGEACDYVAMRAEVIGDLADGNSFSLPDLDLSWLEWPDIDLSSLFDWFDF